MTYLLLCAAAAVWGIIIYRLVSARAGEEDQAEFLHPPVVHEAYDKYLPKKDTTHLALSYRDPFPGKRMEPEQQQKPAAGTVPVTKPFKPSPPPVNWSGIRYSGYFVNPKTKRIIAILTVNGKERMIAEGESLEGVKLLKNSLDSILVSWMGEKKYIKQ